jgi:hypothetical protein
LYALPENDLTTPTISVSLKVNRSMLLRVSVQFLASLSINAAYECRLACRPKTAIHLLPQERAIRLIR